MNFNRVLAIPFGYVLSAFFALSGNYILSLFLLTLLVRLILLPTAIHQQKGQAKQLRLQPKVNKIREKYANEGREGQMKISQETQDLYKKEGYNATTAGCLPLLLQLPVMMGLYGLIYTPLSNVLHLESTLVTGLTEAVKTIVESASENTSRLATQLEILVVRYIDQIPQGTVSGLTEDIVAKIHDFGQSFRFFGLDLTLTTSENKTDWKMWIIPALAVLSSVAVQLYTTLKQRKTQPEAMKGPAMGCMMVYGPAISGYFSYILPLGVGLYWIMSNVISLIQTVAMSLIYTPSKVIAMQMVDETVQRRAREKSVKQIKELTS
ncbi:MAG: YidC/Oxa1 family membrane protein insertase [Clostridia bacterium]|nr:YidC/Oxa1 family membrane protein insertase [Clostridia bacterium]